MPFAPMMAADTCEELARAAAAANFPQVSQILMRAAAEIDLTDAALQQGWGGPMNGQLARQKVVRAIIEAFKPSAIVETGTFRAETTLWFAQGFTGHVFTCELSPRYFIQSAMKLRPFPNVTVSNTDSRTFLRDLCKQRISGAAALFYLDAHWGADLPLAEEIEIVLARGGSSVIVIDDFEVEGDAGYGFDDYGPGKRLDLSYIAPFWERVTAVMLPATLAAQETGARRGMCVLASDGAAREAIYRVSGLIAMK